MKVHALDQARELVDFEVLYTRTNLRDPEIQLSFWSRTISPWNS